MYNVIYLYNSHGVYTQPWLSEIKIILHHTGHSLLWLSLVLPKNIPIVHAVKICFKINMYKNEIHLLINFINVCYTGFLKGILDCITLSPYNRK